MKLACKATFSKPFKNQNPETHLTKPSQVLPPYFSLKMDTLIKQTRRRHPASQEKNREVGSSTREKKVPARKSVSFKEDKKKPSNWLLKQFSRQMSGQSYDPIGDMDHAAAVAATAYAISTFEETWLESYHNGLERGPSLSRSKSRSEDKFPSEEPRSLSRRFSGQLSFRDSETKDHKHPTPKSPVRKSSSVKKTFSMNLREDHTIQNEDLGEKRDRQRKQVSEPPRIQPPVRTRSERRAPPPPPPLPPLLSPPPLRLPPREMKRQSSGHASRKDDSTADAWEKAELAKIKARYEKLNRKIDLWEAKKRDKARRKLDISESEQEQKRKRGLQRFREDTEYIEQIAAGARAQAEKERQSKEFKVKEKAGVIRSTGELPGKACCF
ncbi:PREDICTED: MICAL C-terminal-like protein isoform X2 [Camelina sativa]|uniref:MICAL C-terminal-like protein isoform X2 n=1 Tax=Camelina sativa TaxID=90675 RepID=A0ABM1QVU8_CAMSA|nr:PREDICTED: MICAL C-terminal-like protein isoform X2 [Camelina sativa]